MDEFESIKGVVSKQQITLMRGNAFYRLFGSKKTARE